MTTKAEMRIERDSMGPMEVPADALYGASTMRAVLNFPISNLRFPRSFIRALGLVKQAAATTNMGLGLLDRKVGEAIVAAAQEVVDGKLDEHFVLDIFQTGSGTSTNTNANEVIANRASQILGGDLGSRLAHPNDHVNMGQSSNDVIPTCIHLAALQTIKEDLIPGLERLKTELSAKSDEFWPIVKTGRTHLQDATPIRLGQQFLGFAGQAENSIRRLGRAQEALAEVALGGTAVGTGVNTHPEFSARTCQLISETTGVAIRETSNHFQAQATIDALVEASGILKTIAISLHKIANDIRFMACGPRAGLGEITVPEVQPGSSIMPGKVNPVIAESVIQVVGPSHGQPQRGGRGCPRQLLRVEHHDAGGGPQHSPVHLHPGLLGEQLRRAVRQGHRGDCGGTGDGGKGVDARDRLGAGHRLRRRCGHCQGGRGYRKDNPRSSQAEYVLIGRGVGRFAGPAGYDGAGPWGWRGRRLGACRITAA